LWSNLKTSLIVQIRFLFVISLVVILGLWGFFYIRQKHLQDEHNMARYFSIASSLQPVLLQSFSVSDEDLKEYNVKIFTQKPSSEAKMFYHKGDELKGFSLFSYQGKKVLYVYNPIGSLYLEDLEEDYALILIHSIFAILLGLQTILFMVSKKMLTPLMDVERHFKRMEGGDYSEVAMTSQYKEINQITHSYNKAIRHIGYLLETREMFNKIFMHEMKTPLAKGMFYLKNEPSIKTHEQIHTVFEAINTQLNTFKTLEELIGKNETILPHPHTLNSLLEEVSQTLHVKDTDAIQTEGCEGYTLYGDKELWLVCLKNILDNALQYSENHKVSLTCKENKLHISNVGEPLPIDISQNLHSWKLDKTQRHKSSTGYGFGLFIIQKTIHLNGYIIDYSYENRHVTLTIFKK